MLKDVIWTTPILLIAYGFFCMIYPHRIDFSEPFDVLGDEP